MRELLFSVTKKDLKLQVFRCGGKGGQKQNKTSSGVRIIHKESGAVGESRGERSQSANKKIAFRRMVNSGKFKAWHTRKANEILGEKTIEEKVVQLMSEENLIIETRENGIYIKESR